MIKGSSARVEIENMTGIHDLNVFFPENECNQIKIPI